jgi:phosphatidate cytidylyltransferase
MLKHRLFSGILMTVFFTGIVVFDGWLDGSLTASATDDKNIQGTILGILVAILIILSQREFSALAAIKNLKAFNAISIVTSILLSSTWYWTQFIGIQPAGSKTALKTAFGGGSAPVQDFALLFYFFLLTCAFLLLLLQQYLLYGTEGVLANCGVNCFSIIYFGFLSGFVLAIRIDFGLWALLMYVFVVKCSDIGAYAIGSSFGRHKFSPKISPSKTWEGMAAAIASAIIVALVFALSFDIMVWWLAIIFGFCFAFIAQLGDLVESMIKRDAKQKDSTRHRQVPGFGGVLDIVDSPLVAAPFAYLFFILLKGW